MRRGLSVRTVVAEGLEGLNVSVGQAADGDWVAIVGAPYTAVLVVAG